MKLYAFIFMGEYAPEHHVEWDYAGQRTSIFTVGSFEEAKPLVKKLYEDGYGCLELCGAFSREMCDELMEMTDRNMAIGAVTHNPVLDPAFDRFFAG
ncbi:MAG: DUF6506 family protein [Clostridiales bacterium]|nr:DUF6506 family protein [Clostridiales bacterium]